MTYNLLKVNITSYNSYFILHIPLDTKQEVSSFTYTKAMIVTLFGLLLQIFSA